MRRGLLALAIASSLVLAACGGDEGSEAGSGAAAVTVKVFQFKPSPITVKAGTTVKWTNEDVTLHDVTAGTREAPSKDFAGPLDKSGGTYEHTFDKAGSYDYFCSLHSGPGMTSKVIVE